MTKEATKKEAIAALQRMIDDNCSVCIKENTFKHIGGYELTVFPNTVKPDHYHYDASTLVDVILEADKQETKRKEKEAK
jgi:hypothetical protein